MAACLSASASSISMIVLPFGPGRKRNGQSDHRRVHVFWTLIRREPVLQPHHEVGILPILFRKLHRLFRFINDSIRGPQFGTLLDGKLLQVRKLKRQSEFTPALLAGQEESQEDGSRAY